MSPRRSTGRDQEELEGTISWELFPGRYFLGAISCELLRWRSPRRSPGRAQEELRELASLPELADFEWGEEAKKMLVAWEAAERNKACAIL